MYVNSLRVPEWRLRTWVFVGWTLLMAGVGIVARFTFREPTAVGLPLERRLRPLLRHQPQAALVLPSPRDLVSWPRTDRVDRATIEPWARENLSGLRTVGSRRDG
jgi:hypothetical protein